MRVMSQTLVHARPGGGQLGVVCLVPESSPPIHPAYVQSITENTGTTGIPCSPLEGFFCTTHTRPHSPRPRTGKLITDYGVGLSDWPRCGGAAWPMVFSLRRFKQTQPSHPHTHRQTSTGSSRAWWSPFLSLSSVFPQSASVRSESGA